MNLRVHWLTSLCSDLQVYQMMTQQQHQPSPPGSQDHTGGFPHRSTSSAVPRYPGYLSFPHHRVVEFRPDRKCVLESDTGEQTVVQVSKALVLIGAHPNLSFLDGNGCSLGLNPEEPISCRRNPIEVDPFTNSVIAADGPGMYAMGPLVGENFVRFLKGGALAIASDLAKRQQQRAGGGAVMERCVDRQLAAQTEAELCLVDV